MALTLPQWKPEPCDECGMEGAHHFAERLSLYLDTLLRPITRPADYVIRFATPLADRALNFWGPLAGRFFAAIGLAERLDEPDEHATETALALWTEAKRRGIAMYEIRLLGLPRNLFVAKHRGKTWAFDTLPRPARRQPSLAWIDDKAELKRRFLKEGFPVARGGTARTLRQAKTLFAQLEPPLVIKPREGSNGRHTTVHIETEAELMRAFAVAKKISPWVMVEEQLRGPVFRATLAGGKLVAVLRRDPPCVVGDGARTIRALVEEENKNPLRRGPVFADIKLEHPASLRELARQEFTPESIPSPGQKVFLHFKVNWGVGGTSRDVTSEVHPDNASLFEKIGAYLGDDIIGIDFMIEDIGKSWRDSPRSGVIECNSLPLIGNHHFPYSGPVRNVAGAIWDLVFGDSSREL